MGSNKLFGTDGIRGQVGSFLTPELALQVGYSTGEILRQQGAAGSAILMGQDTRTSGAMLTAAIAAGLTAAGWDVWQLGLCPTPAISYLCAHQPELAGGLMISASHNPPADNGIKIFDARGHKLPDPWQQAIEAHLSHPFPGHTTPWGNILPKPDLVATYEQSLIQPLTDGLGGLHLVLDLAWGSATRCAPSVFQALGAHLTLLHDQPRGDRINVQCGSTHLEPLQAAVLATGADLGFAFDGDADRVLAVDHTGQAVNGDHLLYLWGQDLLNHQQLPESALITTVMANLGFEKAWQKLNGTFIRTAVGDQYVHGEMLKRGAMLGGEQSGHILCRHYGISGDGLLTALHLAALVRRRSPLHELVAQSFQAFPQLLHNVPVPDREHRRHWQDNDLVRSAIDRAIAALGDQGRILVRASGTEPVIRVMVEAQDLSAATHWTSYLSRTIELQLGGPTTIPSCEINFH
ncbi:MAG: phosphoglucosamine mutase [Oscillatoriales cyanobacterium SM2_2_1]|nr:phosphoglucosamine mutase [Oscillatoriales cyanobacterium SM2_2_1]